MADPDGLTNSVRLPLLATELPQGWHVSEGATITAPSGQILMAALVAADNDTDPTALIGDHIATLRREHGEPTEVSTTTSNWRGDTKTHRCTIRFGEDSAHVYTLACVVDNGLALSLTSDWPADGADGSIAMDLVLGGIRLLNRPVFEPDKDDDHAERALPEARQSVSAGVWSRMHAEWSHPRHEVPTPDETTSWSPDELATFATLLSAPSFPTVGTELLASLPDAELHAVLGATMRSLSARGLVQVMSNGSAEIGSSVQSVMNTAVLPDLAIAIQSSAAGHPSSTYFGVRPDHAVQIDTTPNGSRTCSVRRPVDILELVVGVLRSSERAEPDPTLQSQPRQMTADQLSEHWAAMPQAWQVSSTWRTETIVTGRLLYLARDADDQFWVAEPEPQSTDQSVWGIRPVTFGEVRNEVLDCLPGAGSEMR
jgi:hypothetical protein